MTTVAVLCDPPQPGTVLSGLTGNASPLSEEEAATLYTALLRDSCRAVERSGGELLVNYRETRDDAEAKVRSVVEPAIDAVDDVRFERQVGNAFASRAGNTTTHLLEREQQDSVAITTPEAALLTRSQIDTAAMKIRQSPVVLGPAPGGRVYYAGFGEPIDFANVFDSPAIETLTDRAVEAGLDVDFIDRSPLLETLDDLADVVVQFRARRRANRLVPPHTMAVIDDLGLGETRSLDDR
ncbi:hypothetical protein [Halocatena halophila]|uniref:hypothetical protein n=1 Tax=Halocatena halophila TaxID=2814576 RepID=UPI002ED458CC